MIVRVCYTSGIQNTLDTYTKFDHSSNYEFLIQTAYSGNALIIIFSKVLSQRIMLSISPILDVKNK